MAFQNATQYNGGSAYYGNPGDWSKYSTVNSTIHFNNTNAALRVRPTSPDTNTTIEFNGNQLAYASDIPNLANWAQYPANHDVNIPPPYALRAETAYISTLTVYQQTTDTNINVSSFITSTLTVTDTATINNAIITNGSIDTLKTDNLTGSTLTIKANNPSASPATLNLIAQNGTGGQINIEADPGLGNVSGGAITLTSNGGSGVLGLNGSVDIVANSGSSSVVGLTSGGRINITAYSGSNDNLTLTSAIRLSAAGINIQSGYTSPIAAPVGFTFVGGNFGVNSCAGIPPIFPNVIGTNYIYGTSGIVLNSNVYTSDIYPYFNGFVNPNDLTINGRIINVGLGPYNAMVSLNNVKNLAFETAGPGGRTGGQITGLSSINGVAYTGSSGTPTQIEQAGASVVCNIFGGIEMYTATNVDLNLYSGLGVYLNATPDGEIVLQKAGTGSSSQLYFDGVGNVNLRAGTAPGINLTYSTGEITLNNKLNVDTTGEILTFPQVAGSNVGQIEGISTINGTPYVGGGGVPTQIAQGGASVVCNSFGGIVTNASYTTINSAGNIVFNSAGDMVFNDSMFIDSTGDILNFPTTTGRLLGISTINGQAYPAATPPDLTLSTLTMNPNAGFGITGDRFTNSGNGNDLAISQEGTTGRLTMNMGFPVRGKYQLDNDGTARINNITNDGLSIDTTGSILTFPPNAGIRGQIVNLSTINGQAYPIPYFVDSYQIYVAPNGNDTTGTGSQQNPYLTIEKAIVKRATISNTIEVSIILSSGTYTPVGGGIVISQNTFLVGIPTGELNQPVNINCQITLIAGTGQCALFGLSLFPAASQCVVISAVGTYNISNCNITNTGNYCVAQSLGTLFMTNCRINGPTSGVLPAIGGIGNVITVIRDCLITTTGTPSLINHLGSLTLRQCNLINSSASAAVSPLVVFAPTVTLTSLEISNSSLQYTSAVSAANKICLRVTVATGIQAVITNFVNNLLLCEGAQSGSPNFHCVDKTGLGTATMTLGNCVAGATAYRIDNTITHTQYQAVI